MESLKKALDELLQKNIIKKESGERNFYNVIILGPSGWGKSDTVEEWVEQNEIIKPYYWITECFQHSQKIKLSDESLFELYFVPDEINKMDQENTVLILDHFSITDKNARAHLLDLVKNKVVADPTAEDGKRVLDKLWFIVAIAYPDAHFGYDALSEDDLNAFDYVYRINC